MMKELGVEDEHLVSEVSKLWEYSCDQVQLFPETLEALSALRAAGFKTALITNTSRYGWEAIDRKFSLSSCFDHLALSFERKLVKPEPAIFEFIESKTGLVGDAVTMVGDSYTNDFLAPRQRGWNSILLDRAQSNEHSDARPVIKNLLEIKTLLS